jgi:hypothetical protein
VSFTPEDLAGGGAIYNYAANKMNMTELPGRRFGLQAQGRQDHAGGGYRLQAW